MKTNHTVHVDDATDMESVDAESVDLVVTSPPYPMIEMWDGFFADRSETVARSLKEGDARRAFDAMHEELRSVWNEVNRVLKPSGIACVNIGDATRKLNGRFRQYPNHVRIVDSFNELDFDVLPDILWRKPTNSANKFMGSGMIPPNAYVTLEHEYILLFRKEGGPRTIEPDNERRYESAYFWEERNRWFSDLWDDIRGTLQDLVNPDLRDRAAAFPLALPYRLISMFSLQGDTVLDPFWGTGTTSLAAMIGARNSIGFELNETFVEVFDDQLDSIQAINQTMNEKRLQRHRDFVQSQQNDGKDFNYRNEQYDTPVKTKQERDLQFWEIIDCEKTGSTYTLSHEPWQTRSD